MISWVLGIFFLTVCVFSSPRGIKGQSSAPQTTPSQQSTSQSAQDVPDAPSAVQPPADNPEPAPPARPAEAQPEAQPKPVERNPWTNQPINPQPGANEAAPGSQPASDGSAPPPMPPVRTVPPGTSARQSASQEQLYTLTIHSNFVQVPVSVKTKDGRMVDGLLPTDFTVIENGIKQKLSYFSADPFALSVAIVLDLGMSDTAVQEINQTFPALAGSFAPYDEVALYTFSSTVSEVMDFSGATRKLAGLLNQMKTERGYNSGPPVLSGPLAPNGPIVNGIPVGQPTQPVYTPAKESHVLNDAILKAALDLSKRPRTRRKIIFVISDGREYGSKAAYNDVKRVLLSNEIQVKAVAVGSAALPVYGKIERLHLPHEGYGNLLPKYASATGGAPVYTELTRSAIDNIYAEAMSDARNQYTLGYTPAKPKTPITAAYRSIEVTVDRPGLKIYAKDGYYPAVAAR